MATVSGTFTAPGPGASVAYSTGAVLTVAIRGEWPRAILNTEVSSDNGVTWKTVWSDYGIDGAYLRSPDVNVADRPRSPGALKVSPPGSGLFRLNCLLFTSGWAEWAISAP